MATAPTIPQTATTDKTTSTTPKAISSITVVAGDYIEVSASSDGNATYGIAAGGNPTSSGTAVLDAGGWVKAVFSQAGSYGSCFKWYTKVTTGGTLVVSLTSTTGQKWGFWVNVVRGSAGPGTSNSAANTTLAPKITLSGVAANSLLTCTWTDFNANVAARTQQVVNGTSMVEDEAIINTGDGGQFNSHAADSGAGGSIVVGLSAPVTGYKWRMVGLEWLGASAAPAANAALTGSGTLTGAASAPKASTGAALSGSGALSALGKPGAAARVNPISVVGSAQFTTATTVTNIVVPVPAGIQAGDLLVMAAHGRGTTANTLSTPSGWTAPTGGTVIRGSNGRLATWYKVATGAEVSATTVCNESGMHSAQMVALRGVDTSSPFDIANSIQQVSVVIPAPIPDVVTTHAPDIVMVFGALAAAAATQTTTWATPLVKIGDAQSINAGATLAITTTAGYFMADVVGDTAAGLVVNQSTAALSAMVSLAFKAAPGALQTPAMSGSGQLSAGALPKMAATAALSGSGVLSGAAKPGATTTASLSGSGVLSTSGLAVNASSLVANWGIATSNSTDGPVNLGTQFQTTLATYARAIRYYKPDAFNDGETITLSLYDTSANTLLAQVTRVQLASDPIGWITVPLPTPQALSQLQPYMAAWHSTGAIYPTSGDYDVTALYGNNNSLLSLASGGSWSAYAYGSVAQPTSAGSLFYMVDVVIDGRHDINIRAIDSDNTTPDATWFAARAAEGYGLYITNGTLFGTHTADSDTSRRLGLALAAGMRIALYTRDPSDYATGIGAAAPYAGQLQFFALDVETSPGVAVTRTMVAGVVALGIRPVIYTNIGQWPTIQGSDTDYHDIPLWEAAAYDSTSAAAAGYIQPIDPRWPDLLSPPPKQFGTGTPKWNDPSNRRIGVQQYLELVIGTTHVDLNSFDPNFMITPAASAILTGSGSLSAGGQPKFAGTATLSGSGVLSAGAKPGTTAAAALSGAGILAATAVAKAVTAAALGGSGLLTAAAGSGYTGTAVLSGSGVLTAVGNAPAYSDTASLSGSGVLTASASTPKATTAALSGSGTLNGVFSGSTVRTTAALSGSGALTGTATPLGTAGLSGSGLLAVTTLPKFAFSAVLSGSGLLTTDPHVGYKGNALLSGSGLLSITASAVVEDAAPLSGSGILSATVMPNLTVVPRLSGAGQLSIAATLAVSGIADLSGSGELDASATPDVPGIAALLSGEGTLSTVGTVPARNIDLSPVGVHVGFFPKARSVQPELVGAGLGVGIHGKKSREG